MIGCLFLFLRKCLFVICIGSLIVLCFKNLDEIIDICMFENFYWVLFYSLLYWYFGGKNKGNYMWKICIV